jgi:PIN domain nuclease of toxin-antitoxin system
MNVLVNTHILIWFITDDDRLSAILRAVIEKPSNSCLFSIASFGEMGIKSSLEKIESRKES